MTWLLLGLAIVVEVVGTLSLTASRGMTRPGWLLVALVAYPTALALISVVMSRGMPIGVVYGVWVACGVALTALAGRVVFRNPLTTAMAVGIGLIIAGVLIIELGTPSDPHQHFSSRWE